jgi:AraC family transcriptional regulator, L-rhamnose operon transcriptional activator RhaR
MKKEFSSKSFAENLPIGENGTDGTPVLHGSRLFRPGVHVYVNRSDESFSEYMGIPHRHDFIEIVQVISGRGLHRVGQAEYETAPGDLFIINHNVPHGFFPLPPQDRMDLVVYNCVFTPAFLDATLLGADQFASVAQSYLFRSLFPDTVQADADIRLRGADLEEFGALFASMHKEYREEKGGYAEVIRASLVMLLIRVFRLLAAQQGIDGAPAGDGVKGMPDIGSLPTTDTEGLHREIIRKAIAYMKQHATSDLRLEEVAMQSFVSKHYFSRLFHEVTGIRFSEHVQQLRIEAAVKRLRAGQEKVADIALACGFHDLKHFYEVFRRHTGKTPGAYRKQGLSGLH